MDKWHITVEILLKGTWETDGPLHGLFLYIMPDVRAVASYIRCG